MQEFWAAQVDRATASDVNRPLYHFPRNKIQGDGDKSFSSPYPSLFLNRIESVGDVIFTAKVAEKHFKVVYGGQDCRRAKWLRLNILTVTFKFGWRLMLQRFHHWQLNNDAGHTIFFFQDSAWFNALLKSGVAQ